MLCHGQEESSAVMGLGQALFEHMVHVDGMLVTRDPLSYRVPSFVDVPDDFRLIVQEQGHGPGPGGAKGYGEGGMLVVAAAVANAIADATGARVTQLPLTPERVLRAVLAGRAQKDNDV
jgi:CO/xanthine dehydrogenase Mo-binding subunit